MRKFMAILYDTFLEVVHRKMLYLYGAVTFIVLLIFILIPNIQIDGQSIIDDDPLIMGFIGEVLARFITGYFDFSILLMVFGSAGLLPAYLNKGRIELNLSKPISRPSLLMMKFTSVYFIMISILILMCLPLWAVLSIRLGDVMWSFFPGLGMAFVEFFMIYCILFILGLVSRSTAVGIIGYFAISMGTSLLAKREFAYSILNETWQTVLDTIYHILPKLSEVSDNTLTVIQNVGITNSYAIWSSLLFCVILILGSIYIFMKKDY